MKTKPSECLKQARAGCEPNIHRASFTERRLFYLNRLHVTSALAPHTHMLSRKNVRTKWRAVLGSAGMTIYKGMQ
jgi:hypothetical protein